MSELSNKITELDLKPVIARLQRDLGLTKSDCQIAETAYRQFLQLCLDDTGSVPTELADKVWHYHILDTEKYAADCNAIFGKFMHHHPHLERTPELRKATKATQKAWRAKFDTMGICNKSAICNK